MLRNVALWLLFNKLVMPTLANCLIMLLIEIVVEGARGHVITNTYTLESQIAL